MTKKTGLEVDAQTGIAIERELTDDEILELEQNATQKALNDSQAQSRAEAKTSALAKLAALGLTEEEIAAL
jgi:hypothetical protein